MKLFDAFVSCGCLKDMHLFQPDVDHRVLANMMDKYRIAKALLTSFHSFNSLFRLNEIIFATAKQDSRLVPCPLVLPGSKEEIGDMDAFVATLIKRGARCVSYYPLSSNIIHHKLIHDRLFTVLSERRLPVIIPAAELPLEKIVDLVQLYPELKVICSGVSYRYARNIYPVLKACPNFHVMFPFFINQGIEEIVAQLGAAQLIFASNFPVQEPGASIAYLAYARISGENRELIGFENINHLIGGVAV